MTVLDTVNLPLILGDEKYKREVYAEFSVVEITLAYNVILKQPILNFHEIIINIDYLCLKLPAPGEFSVV